MLWNRSSSNKRMAMPKEIDRPAECEDFEEHCEPTVAAYNKWKLVGHRCKKCWKFYPLQEPVEEDKVSDA